MSNLSERHISPLVPMFILTSITKDIPTHNLNGDIEVTSEYLTLSELQKFIDINNYTLKMKDDKYYTQVLENDIFNTVILTVIDLYVSHGL